VLGSSQLRSRQSENGSNIAIDINLALGYKKRMDKSSEAARMLARRSVEARRRKWGKRGFRERMQAWGKLGGRPRAKKGNADAN
jgi:hypothetical protein